MRRNENRWRALRTCHLERFVVRYETYEKEENTVSAVQATAAESR